MPIKGTISHHATISPLYAHTIALSFEKSMPVSSQPAERLAQRLRELGYEPD
jgi:hypothetical protein